MTFPRDGKFTSSHSFASKDVMGRKPLKKLEDYFLHNGVALIPLKSLLQKCQPQRQWCIKFLLPWAQKFYTPLVLGRGSKCPWQFLPPEAVVYEIPPPIISKGYLVNLFLTN